MTRKNELFIVLATYAFLAALLVGVYVFGLTREFALIAIWPFLAATLIAAIWLESDTRARLREARQRRQRARRHRHSLAH